jgi:DNA-binding NtrC family response regulator
MKEPQRKSILVVDDDNHVTDSLQLILTDAGYQVSTARTFAQSTAILGNTQVDLVLTDLLLPDGTGIDVITHVKSETPEAEVILMTGHGSPDITIEAIKRGAYYYLEKPFALDRLHTLVTRALEFGMLRRENEHLKRTLSGDSETFGMIGRNPKLLQIIQTIPPRPPPTPRC